MTRKDATIRSAGLPVLAAAILSAGILAGALGGAGPVEASTLPDPDARWLPWIGCWEPAAGPGAGPGAGAPGEPMVCIRPASDGGVELLTVADGTVTRTRAIRAGGAERPVSDEGCSGTEWYGFSPDGHRLYGTARLTCHGIERSTARLWAVVSPTEWIAVRSVAVEGREAASVDRYRPADPSRVEAAGLSAMGEGRAKAVESARLAASAPVTVEAVIEAHAATGPEVVEAWLAERGEPLQRLDSERLLEMADAGVPGRVVDVAVAVSYPERFRVEREPYGGGAAGPGGDPGGPAYRGAWSPYYGLWGARYAGLGFHPYGPGFYDPYRYRYRHYGGPCVVVVRSAGRTDDGGGRVIAGRGYARPAGDRARAPRPGESIRNAPPAGTPSTRSGAGRKAKPRGSGS